MPRSSTAAPRLALTALLALVAVLPALLQALPALAAPATVSPGAAIEQLSPYQGQTACEPIARAGTKALRDLVLAAYPGTGDSGIVRDCKVGGTSEHKEGRAWDWRVSASNPADVARVDDLIAWLTAPDAFGNSAAMARRLGVMYVIWNHKIWKAYQATSGWQPYSGTSPHTDHVHFSLSWAGALERTSYWTGVVAPVMSRPVATPVPATATATITVGTTPPSTAPSTVVDHRLQRTTVVSRMPGPWRRH